MKKIITIGIMIVAMMVCAGGCGKKTAIEDKMPVVSETAKTDIEEEANSVDEVDDEESVIIEDDQAAKETVQDEKVQNESEQEDIGVSQEEAEKLVKEATGADSVKISVRNEVYAVDCYQNDEYMGTVEVNSKTGEITFQ